MSIEKLTLKAYRGTDPEDGSKCAMFGLHDPETDALKACCCIEDNEGSKQFIEEPESFKTVWGLGIVKLGIPKQIAIDFLTRPDTVLLWSEDILTQYVPGADERPTEETLH